ncbi:transposable element Tcb2 transposase [Trichonephila clavipes]|nr:transposable element Tcb2 transposase [Trichonephila clavipes]
MGSGIRRPARLALLNARHRAARLAWAREHRDWRVEDWKRVAWSNESRFKSPISPDLNPIELLWDVLEQDVQGHLTAPMNLTELWTSRANIWQVIPEECFQKLVESIPRRVTTVIKVRRGPTRY